MPEAALAIDLLDATKLYKGRIRALDNVSLQVHQGEIFGLLGPNGAGKSTLVKILMSVVHPTRARGSVLGQPVGSKASLRRVGYLPEHHRFPRYLTGRQTLEFFGGLSGVERAARKQRAGELLETVGMTAWADARVSTYSKGMMQRVGVAAALINDPQLVILDEPTDGVDPVGRREIRDVLARMKGQGRTVFVNSHLLSELEIISDRVAILVGGRVVRQGTINDLTVDRQYMEIETTAPLMEALRSNGVRLGVTWTSPPEVTARLAGVLATGSKIEAEGAAVRIMTMDAAEAQPVIDVVRTARLVIKRVQQMRPSLEDLFIEAVGGVGGGHAAGAAEGGRAMMTQTWALLLDAYRELNAKKMFWVVLGISVLVLALFATLGVSGDNFSILWYSHSDPDALITYKMIFSYAVVGIWFTWAAVLLALISTAGIFPDFLSAGSIDLYLARPISRVRLFLTKYAAGLLFVLLQVTLFAVASFFILGLRAHLWQPGIFWSIPLILLMFSYLYGICVLLGVMTRSTVAALLLTLLAWLGIFAMDRVDVGLVQYVNNAGVQQEMVDDDLALLDERLAANPVAATEPVRELTRGMNFQYYFSSQDSGNVKEVRDRLQDLHDRYEVGPSVMRADQVAVAVKTFFPKTRETTDLLDGVLFTDKDLQAATQANAAPAAQQPRARRAGRVRRNVSFIDPTRGRSVWWVIGTSVLFEAACLGLASWLFCGRDY